MTLNFLLRSFTLIQIHKYEGQTYCSSALGTLKMHIENVADGV